MNLSKARKKYIVPERDAYSVIANTRMAGVDETDRPLTDEEKQKEVSNMCMLDILETVIEAEFPDDTPENLTMRQDLESMSYEQRIDVFYCMPLATRKMLVDNWIATVNDETAHRKGEINLQTLNKRYEKRLRKYGPCAMCDGLGSMRCSKCKQVHYCGRECQRKHWATHKQECAGCERKRKD